MPIGIVSVNLFIYCFILNTIPTSKAISQSTLPVCLWEETRAIYADTGGTYKLHTVGPGLEPEILLQ